MPDDDTQADPALKLDAEDSLWRGCMPTNPPTCKCGKTPCPVPLYMEQRRREDAARDAEMAMITAEQDRHNASELRDRLSKLDPCFPCIEGFPDRCERVGSHLVGDRYYWVGQPCLESGVSYAAGPPPTCKPHESKLVRSGWPSLTRFEAAHFYHCPAERDGRNCSALWASDVGWLEYPGSIELRPAQAQARYLEKRDGGQI